MTFSGNFMPKRFGQGKPQKPKIKTYRDKPVGRSQQVRVKKGKR